MRIYIYGEDICCSLQSFIESNEHDDYVMGFVPQIEDLDLGQSLTIPCGAGGDFVLVRVPEVVNNSCRYQKYEEIMKECSDNGVYVNIRDASSHIKFEPQPMMGWDVTEYIDMFLEWSPVLEEVYSEYNAVSNRHEVNIWISFEKKGGE